MNQLIRDFPKQLEEALAIGQSYAFAAPRQKFDNVVLTGLGGSGIGGSIVQNFVFDRMAVPFWVNKGYDLPGFVQENTLLLACSYSGNTEETLVAAQKALACGARVVAITSGGKLQDFARANGCDCILIPAGNPPRASVGYSIVQVLTVLNYYGFINGDFQQEVFQALQLLEKRQEDLNRQGRELAAFLNGKLPVIYASDRFEGMAIRFRQQLNENSKELCWHAVIPEMNHNELVGWTGRQDDKAVVLLRWSRDEERVQYRMEINQEIFAAHTPHIREVYAEGESYWEALFSLLHITDWCSVHLAEMRGVNATEVQVIDKLKARLNAKPVV